MNPTQLGQQHGREYAEHTWWIDPACDELAREWIASAEGGTLENDYELPEDSCDAIPADLDTSGWSWQELADYQGAWEAAYFARTTELCREVIAE